VKKVKSKKSFKDKIALISVFMVIMVLALAVYLFQSTNFKTFAGEAIRQRIDETKQLALSKEAAKIVDAEQEGKDSVFLECPHSLTPKEQHWEIPSGWDMWTWKAVDVKCPGGDRVFCYYADDNSELSRADQLVIYQDFPKVKNCAPAVGVLFPGCNCVLN
jgi:hypothetical protein